MSEETIQHDGDSGKFKLTLEEQEAVLSYRKEDGVMDIYRTYTPESFRGKGIAGKLVEEAFRYAREQGLKVRPTCPYVASYMEKHEEHQDLEA